MNIFIVQTKMVCSRQREANKHNSRSYTQCNGTPLEPVAPPCLRYSQQTVATGKISDSQRVTNFRGTKCSLLQEDLHKLASSQRFGPRYVEVKTSKTAAMAAFKGLRGY